MALWTMVWLLYHLESWPLQWQWKLDDILPGLYAKKQQLYYCYVHMHHISIHIYPYLSFGALEVQVVCSMENCDVSPSTLTGCARCPVHHAAPKIPWVHGCSGPISQGSFSGIFTMTHPFHDGNVWILYEFCGQFQFKACSGEVADLHCARSRSVSWLHPTRWYPSMSKWLVNSC